MINAISNVLDRVLPRVLIDKDKRLEVKAALEQQFVEQEYLIVQEAAMNIRADASSDSWLQRSWRPIVMLFLTSLLGIHWISNIFALSINRLPESETIEMFNIIKLGLTGFIVTRGGEKIMREWKK